LLGVWNCWVSGIVGCLELLGVWNCWRDELFGTFWSKPGILRVGFFVVERFRLWGPWFAGRRGWGKELR